MIAAGAIMGLRDYAARHPEAIPWAALDLSDPTGSFTGRKLTALTGEASQCRILLKEAGVRFTPLPARIQGQCGYRDGVRLLKGGPLPLRWEPSNLGVACPVAAALFLWNRDVVQPAAARHLRAAIVRIETLGSYSCRRIYGRPSGAWSEHATADAIDIAGFSLAGGSHVRIRNDWSGGGRKAAFLRDVRDGACKLFATVLSPDYNRAHANHLHLDQAERGTMGWRACR